MSRPLIKKADFALIAALVVGVILAAALPLTAKGGASVKITQDGQTVAELPLAQDSEMTVGTVKIVIEGGAAYIAESDCADKICVRTGRLKKVGDTAVCLPNKLVVTVVGDQSAPDGVTY